MYNVDHTCNSRPVLNSSLVFGKNYFRVLIGILQLTVHVLDWLFSQGPCPVIRELTDCTTPLPSSASDDIPNADEVRALVKDVWDLRLAKLRKSTDLMIRQQETHAKVCC